MTSRQIRRAAERKFRKLAQKGTASATPPPGAHPHPAPGQEQHQTEPNESCPPAISPARLAANRANAQHSTGPRSADGKATSSRNNFRHGFRSAFALLPYEDEADFEALRSELEQEHQPDTLSEHMLVDKMAEHHWLSQRAQRLQNALLANLNPQTDPEKCFSLYLRYQAVNDRGYAKCLHDLSRHRADKRKAEADLQRQQHRDAAELRCQQIHEARLRTANAKAAAQETKKPAAKENLAITALPPEQQFNHSTELPAQLLSSPAAEPALLTSAGEPEISDTTLV